MSSAGSRALVALLTFFFLLLTPGCKQAGIAKERPKWDIKAMKWEHDPVVKVCAGGPVTAGQVQYSLDLWAKHGAPQLTAVASACSSFHDHAVYIHYPPTWMVLEHWGEDTVGLTVVYSRTPLGPPVSAEMGLISDDMKVLTHEVGHLWLPEHYPGKDHVITEWMDHFDWRGWDDVRQAFK